MLLFKILVLIAVIILGAYVCNEGKTMKYFRISSKILSLWVVIVLASEIFNQHSWEKTLLVSTLYIGLLGFTYLIQRLTKAEGERDSLRNMIRTLEKLL